MKAATGTVIPFVFLDLIFHSCLLSLVSLSLVSCLLSLVSLSLVSWILDLGSWILPLST